MGFHETGEMKRSGPDLIVDVIIMENPASRGDHL
jgi:hypothetical protein